MSRENIKNVLIICLSVALVVSSLTCWRYRKSLRDADIRAGEYQRRYAGAVSTIVDVRGEIGEIRRGLERDADSLQSVIDKLREVAERVKELEDSLGNFDISVSIDSNNRGSGLVP